MNVAKQCQDRFEDIVALVMGVLDPAAARELQDHIALCGTCQAARDVLVEEEKEVRSGFEALARSLGPVEHAVLGQQHRSRVCVDESHNHFLERVKTMILAHKRLSVAAATMMALAASVILYVSLFSSSTAAYALEQTVQANNHITSYHVKVTPAAELGEGWVELNPDGTLLRARMDLSNPDDGPKVSIVWPNRLEVWFKARNFHFITNNQEVLDHSIKEVMRIRALFDPKLALEQLQADEKAGKGQVATKEPAKEGEPITLTVTCKGEADRRRVFEVDPTEQACGTNDRIPEPWRPVGAGVASRLPRLQQRDRSESLPTGIAQRHYHARPDQDGFSKIGLAKGELTDDQIATKVAKECFEALIAADYQKAGQLFRGGISGEILKQAFEQKQKIKFLRIVEIGKPTTVEDPRSSVKIMGVPVKVEMETSGKKTVTDFSLQVLPAKKNSDRWSIGGGL